ncbi:MAG: GIY-YIG nuclease family protein [Candidatus Acidiferrales bacterium]
MPGTATAANRIWFWYMVRCSDGSLYVGLQRMSERVKRHNWGVGPEFTAKRRLVELIWSERCGSSLAAREREREIKSWSRKKKLALVQRGSGTGSAAPDG